MATGEKHPLIEKLVVPVAASATAVSTSFVTRVPFAGTVTASTFVPVAAITGAATNNRSIAVVNRKQDGTGTTSVASITYASGVNAVAYDENVVTLSGTAANLVVAAGDVLEIRSTANGTGLADPGGSVIVTVNRD